MRDTLLRAAPWFGLSAAAIVGLCVSLWPVAEPAAPALEDLPPPAATSPALDESTPARSSTGPAAAPLDVAQLTERAKQQLALDPAAALQDIAQADKLHGPEADALNETRRVIEIHALVKLGKVGLARTLTDRFYRTFPNSDRAAELERLTGYHPRPTGP